MQTQTIDISYNSGQQAIILPDNLKINDNKVYVKKIGNVIFIIPFHNPWQSLIDSLEKFTPDYLDDRNQQTIQNRELFD